MQWWEDYDVICFKIGTGATVESPHKPTYERESHFVKTILVIKIIIMMPCPCYCTFVKMIIESLLCDQYLVMAKNPDSSRNWCSSQTLSPFSFPGHSRAAKSIHWGGKTFERGKKCILWARDIFWNRLLNPCMGRGAENSGGNVQDILKHPNLTISFVIS